MYIDYTRYDNIITSHISNTGGNLIIDSDKEIITIYGIVGDKSKGWIQLGFYVLEI